MSLVSKISVKELNKKIRLAHSDSKKIDYFYRRFVATESFSLERPETCTIYSPDMENGKSPSRLSFCSLSVLRIIFGRYHSPVSACLVNYRRKSGKLSAYARPINRWSVSTSSRYNEHSADIGRQLIPLCQYSFYMINYRGARMCSVCSFASDSGHPEIYQ